MNVENVKLQLLKKKYLHKYFFRMLKFIIKSKNLSADFLKNTIYNETKDTAKK